jgi:hypothetical protein
MRTSLKYPNLSREEPTCAAQREGANERWERMMSATSSLLHPLRKARCPWAMAIAFQLLLPRTLVNASAAASSLRRDEFTLLQRSLTG